MVLWTLSHQADVRVNALADRHYSRKTPGSKQCTPPGRKLVLLTPAGDAVWVSSWPLAEYVMRDWKDAWICTLFRNESSYLSSNLIREAISWTRAKWGAAPASGMITMIDPLKVRKKRDPGRCYRKAGFKWCGETKGGLLVLQLLPCDMPPVLSLRDYWNEVL